MSGPPTVARTAGCRRDREAQHLVAQLAFCSVDSTANRRQPDVFRRRRQRDPILSPSSQRAAMSDIFDDLIDRQAPSGDAARIGQSDLC
jgi:hypothetical protein